MHPLSCTETEVRNQQVLLAKILSIFVTACTIRAYMTQLKAKATDTQMKLQVRKVAKLGHWYVLLLLLVCIYGILLFIYINLIYIFNNNNNNNNNNNKLLHYLRTNIIIISQKKKN